jgi:DNA (cytosine-5)-methyltransferase 1
MRIASFFSGIGGFDLGFQRAGMEVIFQCEVNNFNQKILEQHWPEVTRHGDIRTLDPTFIPQSDVWCAGFPCQDVSLANNGKREGLNGKRSRLFYEFSNLVEQRYPRWIILENVPGLLSSQNGEDFRTVIKTLDEFGYGVAWRILDAKFFGTPQRRRRVFIVASYQSICAAEVLFDNERTPVLAEPGKREAEGTTPGLERSDPKPTVYTIQNAAIGRVHTSGPQGPGYRCDGETWTFDSRGRGDAVCTPYDSFGVRAFTGIPGGVDSARYTSLGNAVNVLVAEWIGRGIMRKELADTNRQSECLTTLITAT